MEGNDHGEAYTAIVRGGLLSRVSSNVVGAEAFSVARRRHVRRRYARRRRPTEVEDPITHEGSTSEPGRSHVRPAATSRSWSASGRRGAVADDARAREVRLRHSSWEADEQGRAIGCGAGGAKGGGQGECGPAQHAPGTGPGKRVPCAGPHTTSRKATPSNTRGGSRMREIRPYGSVRGASSNGRSYRELLSLYPPSTRQPMSRRQKPSGQSMRSTAR